MPYVTSVERIGIEKGMQQGLKKGMQEGMQQGMQQGAAGVLLQLMARRFGPLDEATRARIAKADPDRLLEWSERILDAPTLNDVLH
ncbi:DUF4351 domain-containing protein [Thiorhodovibrio litoralis]|uniref:DUF4351 domain-containing protein n=1 Tax=Thiorhodovibrio litoralis TaxID=2952932 RepID=UPI002B2591EB|nr:DUF4351 domain-containing protein [Thiorhodovibrio litoralis]WPL14160.1 hypothetical protein Thiosp_03993 [Thiorhodovibrio litoralis]